MFKDGLSPRTARQRWTILLLIVAAVFFGWLSVKRAVNGNADLTGNYNLWRANLHEPLLPVRREGPDSQDPDAYPPITYALFAPLGALPLGVTAALWYVINLGCSVYLWRAARDWIQAAIATTTANPLKSATTANSETQHAGIQRSDKAPGLVVRWLNPSILESAVAGVVLAWIGSLLLGQNTLLLMTLTWAGFQCARRQQPWLAGTLLAFATTIKVLPVVFLLPFVLTRNYRVVAAFAISGMILVGGLGSAYFGPQTNFDFHRRWLQFVIQGPENRAPDPLDPNTLRGSLRFHNQAIETVLARLMMEVPIHNRPGAPRVNLINVSAATWRRTRSVATGVCVLLGLVMLYQSTRTRSSGIESAQSIDTSAGETSVETYSVLCLLQLLVSPIVWSHYYLWLFWPLVFLLVEARRGRRSGYAIYLAWLIGIPCMAVPQLRAIGVHLALTLALFLWIGWPRLQATFNTRQTSQ